MILPLFAIGAALLGAALASFVVGRRPRGWSDGGLSGVAGQLIDGMHDGLAVQDSEGRLVAWNHAACQITGWDHADAARELERRTTRGSCGSAARWSTCAASRCARRVSTTA